MIADSFNDLFWPTLWATLVGVAVGIPVGLALDALRRKREETATRERERARIEHVLRVVKKSVDDNAAGLRELLKMMEGDHLFVDPGISKACGGRPTAARPKCGVRKGRGHEFHRFTLIWSPEDPRC